MKTVDVSGLGGAYENHCQLMIKAAMDTIDQIGVPTLEEMQDRRSEKYKAIEKAMLAAVDGDATGASFGCSLAHAYQRKTKGEDWYFNQYKDSPDGVYEWDGTVSSCPVTELSKTMEARENEN